MQRALLLLAGLAAFLTPIAAPAPAMAQDVAGETRYLLGAGRLFSNDYIGDGKDRWRSGSYMVSLFRGRGGDGVAGTPAENVLEYRFRTEIIAPANLITPAPDDRRYAGVLSFGLHRHFTLAGLEARAGADLVVVGPQTGVGAFQREAHELLGLPRPRVLGAQLPDAVYPTASLELGRSLQFGANAQLRPFVEMQTGVEDLARVGMDLTLGHGFDGAVMTRDPVTGQRVQGVPGSDATGLTFTLGADIAHVFDSALLPSSGPAPLREDRARLRAGVNWRGERSEVFYGLTWLGPEFDTQKDEQVLGSLRLRLRF